MEHSQQISVKAFILILSILCLWLKLASGVVVDGVIRFVPNGAISYSLWKSAPGDPRREWVATFTNSSFTVIGPTPDGTTFYLKGVYRFPNDPSFCCLESDYGFVVTPPSSIGTNTLRFIGPVTALRLQSANGAAGPWSDIGIYTNAPLALAIQPKQFMRTIRTNLPPPLP
jgi:hypothetical protein